jgi:hypothetical protein
VESASNEFQLLINSSKLQSTSQFMRRFETANSNTGEHESKLIKKNN